MHRGNAQQILFNIVRKGEGIPLVARKAFHPIERCTENLIRPVENFFIRAADPWLGRGRVGMLRYAVWGCNRLRNTASSSALSSLSFTPLTSMVSVTSRPVKLSANAHMPSSIADSRNV
jgi:hypothetical protein